MLEYSGYNPILTLPRVVSDGMFLLWLLTTIGLVLFLNVARLMFVVLLVLGLVSQTINGLVVETFVESVILSAVNILDGIILALIYFSPLEEEFE